VRAQYFPRYAVRDWSITMSRTTLARIVDPVTGAEITEAGVPGELRIKGPGVFPGYLKTGDICEIAGDEGQYLRYVDRSKDLVVRGGMKISAAELEGFIAGHPKVADVAVVAYPDEVLGERACAIVVARPGETVSLAEIVGYLREIGIATFKLPERLELRDELPRNPLGKVLKRELRAELRGAHDLPGRWAVVQVRAGPVAHRHASGGLRLTGLVASRASSAGTAGARPASGCGRRSRSASA